MAPVGGLALLCLLPAVFLPATVAAARDGPYLSWGAKNAPVQQAGNAAQVPVPPSPYGQVGDPYLHVLNWSAKSGSAQPSRPNPPPPVALPDPEPVRAYSPPQYRAQPAPRPALAAQAPLEAPTKTPAPSPAQAPAQAPGQASVAPPDDGAYHVPASSPYAARIAAARAAQSKADQAKAEQPKAITPAAANSAQATQGQAALTDAPADDDKPFVPGEHYTDASEAPRLYSLHRAYGLKPDPITVDSNASGAVLDTSHLDAAEAKGMKGDKTDEDSDDDDGVPAKSTDAPSAPGTQNASAGKTEKTAQ